MATIETRQARQTVFVDTFTNGLLGPDVQMLGPVADGGHIVVNTTPGCWGPMITPSIRGGHEVCMPVAVEGARSATRSRSASATSRSPRSPPRPATTRRWRAASTATRTCAPVCAECGTEWPETRVEGIGPESIRCANCGADATPFTFTNGYTMAFDPTRTRSASRSTRTRRRASPTPPRGWPRSPTTRCRTRSCCSRRTTSSAWPRACARSWASSAPRRRRRCPTRTTPATSARS